MVLHRQYFFPTFHPLLFLWLVVLVHVDVRPWPRVRPCHDGEVVSAAHDAHAAAAAGGDVAAAAGLEEDELDVGAVVDRDHVLRHRAHLTGGVAGRGNTIVRVRNLYIFSKL